MTKQRHEEIESAVGLPRDVWTTSLGHQETMSAAQATRKLAAQVRFSACAVGKSRDCLMPITHGIALVAAKKGNAKGAQAWAGFPSPGKILRASRQNLFSFLRFFGPYDLT